MRVKGLNTKGRRHGHECTHNCDSTRLLRTQEGPLPEVWQAGPPQTHLAAARVRTVVYMTIAYLEITCGEYQARCDCCTTFRSTPEGVLPRAHYDNKVRDLVLARIIEDGLNIERTLQSLRRDFLLNLSTGFVYDLLRDRAAELDLAEHRRMVLEHFSGTLCVDELHLGHFTLLLATDPLGDLPVAFALVGANDHDHMRRFLRNLKNWGLEPRTVVTDGSNLYPALLAELWSEADHQLCAFHILKDINQRVLEAVRRLRRTVLPAGPGRPEEEAGPQGGQDEGPAGPDAQGEVGVRVQAPYLIVKRRENFAATDHDDLEQMLVYLPELATLRQFADRIHWLFDTPKDYHQASCRRAAIVRDRAFRAVPELVKAMEQLSPEKFPKIMAYLNNPAGRRVRTNNHVERTNRMVRFLEKVRYKWRRRKTLVRFVILRLDSIWSHWVAPEARGPKIARIRRRPRTQASTRRQPRRVA